MVFNNKNVDIKFSVHSTFHVITFTMCAQDQNIWKPTNLMRARKPKEHKEGSKIQVRSIMPQGGERAYKHIVCSYI